ncbi:hypothetical protein RJO53_003053 [Enterobacter hormaechei]|nr:hypothetical protein [Enterobacter hormaechei]ELC6543380.1 hypothetical protein [Enterobacter hormaechei]
MSGAIGYGNSCIPATSKSGVFWNIKGFGIYADAAIASSARGNYCYNTNTSIQGGIGLVAANGTTWVSLI